MIAPGVPAPQSGRPQRNGVDGRRADAPTAGPPDAATRPAGDGPPPAPLPASVADDPRDLDRQRLARDLHDVVGQALTAVRLAIVALGRDGLPDRSRAPPRRVPRPDR